MSTDFKLPDLGEGIESGDVVDILVAVGDVIQADQDVLELETEKAVIPVPCSIAGKIEKIHVAKGDTVTIGAVILSLGASGAATSQQAQAGQDRSQSASNGSESAAPATSTEPVAAATTTAVSDHAQSAPPQETREASQQDVAASTGPSPTSPSSLGPDSAIQDNVAPAGPDTRRYARELGVDLNHVAGTGEGGRITKDDVQRSVRETMSGRGVAPTRQTAAPRPAIAETNGRADRDAFGPVRIAPLPRIRQAIARNMAKSASEIPHVTNFDDADITELNKIRKTSTSEYGDVKLTMMPFVIKACALALRRHPDINASLDLENNQVIHKEYVNIGIAVDTPRGLVVPVMRDADRQSIPALARGLAAMAESARDGKFSLDDLKGGSFTISNLGAIGGTYSTPIINHPEVAIVLLGRSRLLPVVVGDDEVEIRLMMPLSISYDHRQVDGATAARFLNEVKDYLQNPGRLLLAP